MQLQKLLIRGVLAFAEPVEIDWSALPEGLIAIVGRNGAGKSTILDSVMASLYREMPSRPKSIYDYAHGRDSLIEAEWDRCITRVELDAVRRQSRPFVLRADRQPETDGKADSFDEWVRQSFPPLSVMLATAFAAQTGRGSFRTLSRTARKDLFSKLLGLERYQELADVARRRVDGAATEQGQLEAQLEIITASVVKLPALQERVEQTEGAVEGVDLEVEMLQAKKDEAGRQVKAAADAHAALERRAVDHHSAVAAAKTALQDYGTAEHALGDADNARARIVATNTENLERARRRLERARRELDVAAPWPEAPDVDAARERVRQAHVNHAAAEEARIMAVRRKDEAETASLVADVPCKGEGVYAECQFLKRATLARNRIGDLTPEQAAAALDERVTAVQDTAAAVQEADEDLSRATAAAHELANWKTAHDAAAKTVEHEQREIEAIEAGRVDAEREAEIACTARKVELDEQAERLKRARQKVQETADVAGELAAAVDALNTAEAALTRAEGKLDDARVRRQHAQENLAVARAELQRVQDLEKDQAALEGKIDVAAGQRSNAGVLAKAFGRTGIPVLEIDAAGPVVSDLTNQLLRASYGERFTVSLETQAAKASGAGQKETFDLSVWDGDVGRRHDLTDLSGGEQVVVDEALKAALALHLRAHSGYDIPTCWRDETTGPIDEINIDHYIQMLRALKKVGGFHQIVFISHHREAAALADARLVVEDGRVLVR